MAEAPAWPGRAQPQQSQAWDTQNRSLLPTPRTAQSAAYRVPGAATTKLKPQSKSLRREETRRRQSPRTPRAAPPAAASCGGISANFKNHSRPSRRLPWLRWAGSVAPFPQPALPQAGERAPSRGVAGETNGAALPLPHATGFTAGYRGQGRPPREEAGCPRQAKPYPAFPLRPLEPSPRRRARGPRRARREKKLAPSPRFPLRGEAGSQNSVCGRSCWE